MKKEFKLNFLGRDLIVETGQLAKQTNGSVLVRYGDTVVLSVCVMGKTPVTQDFFPLQVLYQEITNLFHLILFDLISSKLMIQMNYEKRKDLNNQKNLIDSYCRSYSFFEMLVYLISYNSSLNLD